MRLRSPAPFSGDVAHQQSARLTCERQRGQHSSLPPFSRGHSSASQSGCFTCIRSKARILLPSPFLSLWCSPVNMPASHAGDHRSEAGQGHQFHFALKALAAMHSLGKRFSSVQLRVRAPQSSQRSSRHHKPAQPRAALGIATILPPRSSLRISFVKNSRRSVTGWRLHPLCSRSPTQRHDVENVASAGASPAASTSLRLLSFGSAGQF